MKHAVTKYRIRLDCYRAKRIQGRLRATGVEAEWVELDQVPTRPLSVTGRKIAQTLKSEPSR